MFSFDSHFSKSLQSLKSEGGYRTFRTIERSPENFPRANWQGPNGSKEVVVWCSNDYLGMGSSPIVRNAMHDAIEHYGAGAGGTRNISGTHPVIVELELELAQSVDKEAALMFSSGYVANQTALAALARGIPDVAIISDEMNHDSIIQGLRLGRCHKMIFRHNSPEHLEQILSLLPAAQPKIVVFESVYSMEGSFGALKEICDVAKAYSALTYLDETHAVGLYGHKGGGVAQLLGLTDQIDVIQGGLGKGFGVVGGFIAANALLIDFVRSFGNGFIFTTTMPPCVAAGALSSVLHLRESQIERCELEDRVMQVKCALAQAGIPMIDTPSHIIPVMIGDAHRCKQIADMLLTDFGIYIQPINFPTVPRGTERLRITPTPSHTSEMISHLSEALAAAFEKLSLSYHGSSHWGESVAQHAH